MTIKFDDGSRIDTDDFARMLSLAQQRAKDAHDPKNKGKKIAQATEIIQQEVTIKLQGFKAKDNVKLAAHENYIESTHKMNGVASGWTIRVWRIEESKTYGCNYFCGEDVRYTEINFDGVRDENGVFKYVGSLIEDIVG